MAHQHRPVPERNRIVGWSHCVAQGGCDGAAHGAVTIIDECSCGALRRVESNGLERASSGWFTAQSTEQMR